MRESGIWNTVDTAPREKALEVRVAGEPAAVDFPCRLSERGWVNAETNTVVDIQPAYWRLWRGRHASGRAQVMHRVNAMLIGRELSARHTAAMDQEMPEHLSSLLEKLAEREDGGLGEEVAVAKKSSETES